MPPFSTPRTSESPKTSESHRFSDVFRGQRKGTLGTNGLTAKSLIIVDVWHDPEYTSINPLSANSTKWSDTQTIRQQQPANYFSVFDHFVASVFELSFLLFLYFTSFFLPQSFFFFIHAWKFTLHRKIKLHTFFWKVLLHNLWKLTFDLYIWIL